MKFLGIDPESDTPAIKQLAERLDSIFKSTRFTDIYQWIEDTFGNDFKKVGKMIDDTTKHIIIYSGAAFKILGEGFGKLGDIFAFHFGQFINQYKPELLATLGASIGFAAGSMFGIKGAALGALIAGTVGYAIGKITQSRSPEDVKRDIELQQEDMEKARTKLKSMDDYAANLPRGQREAYESSNFYTRRNLESQINLGSENLDKLYQEKQSIEEKFRSLGSVSGALGPVFSGQNWEKMLEEQTRNYESKRPERVSELKLNDSQKRYAQMIYDEFYKEFKSDTIARAAVANAYEESRLVPNETNLTGENSRGLFQINLNDEANRAFLQKEYGTRMFDALLDPKTNIEAMIKLMKTAPGNIAKLKQEGTLEGATRRMMLDFLRPRDQSEPAQMKRVGNLTIANRLLDGSVDLDNARRYAASSGATAGTTIINNNNNNVGSTGASRSTGAYNVDAAELFFGPLIRGFN